MIQHLALLVALPSALFQGTVPQSLWGDWNLDARPDLLLVQDGRPRLFEDDGASGYRDATQRAGLDAWDGLSAVLWQDLDGDGNADLLLARHAGAGACLTGLATGGFGARASLPGLDLERSLARVEFVGDALLLEGRDGLRLARRDRAAGWREHELLSAPASPARFEVEVASASTPGAGAAAPQRATPAASPLTGVVLGGTSSAATLPPLNGICAGFLEDEATGNCLSASSTPALGLLYPLSLDWNVSAAGDVGVGTSSPTAKLDVIGAVRAQQLISTASAFSAPLVVGSTVKVTNLNADRLDGFDSSAFSQLGNSIEGSEISPGTIGADRLANPLSASGTAVTTLGATASGLTSIALRGTASGGTGNIGVHGESTSTSGLAYGVRGVSASTTGRAISGEATASTGANVGVYASTPSTSGIAVSALASSANGLTVAVQGTNASTDGIGVYGLATKSGVFDTFGVVGEVTSEKGAGVLGQVFNPNNTLTPVLNGVKGNQFGFYGAGVFGQAYPTSSSAYNYGVRGENASSSGWGVFSAGDTGATGIKSFVQPHPADASKEIRFVCLEGNESGTYFRGSGRVVGGLAVIEVPEEFRLVSESEGLTVQLTARGPGRVWVEAIDLDRLIVRGDALDFDYLVNGFRRGFRDIELLRKNMNWVPLERGVPYGTQYPDALRRILVENGTLNPDFTPNEATAAQQGWSLLDPLPQDGVAGHRAAALAAQAADSQP